MNYLLINPFLVTTDDPKTVIFDESKNQSITFWTFFHHIDMISHDRKYILQLAGHMLQILKFGCQSGYFFDNSCSCKPCWINNCSTCDSETGKCLTCFGNNLHLNNEGICSPCSKFCISCQNTTGRCNECLQPYQLNLNFQCDLPSNTAIFYFQIIIQAISTIKIQGLTLLMSFINQYELYNYHNRSYGNRTILYLKPINIFQFQRLSILGQYKHQQVFSYFKVSSSYNNMTRNKKFISQTNLDNNFWNATFIFFVQILPQTIVVFVLLKLCFLFLFNFRISKYVRQFSFYLFVFPCVFGTHAQYLTYTAANQFQSMVYMSIWDKLLLVAFILFCFVFLLYLIAFPFFIFIFHKKTKKYFFDQCLPKLSGAFAINIFSTYKGFLLSIIQSFMFQKYLLQMLLMMSVSIIVIIWLLIIQKKWNCFDRKFSFATFLIHQSLMLLLNLLMVIDYKYREKEDLGTIEVTDKAIEVTMWFISMNIIFDILIAIISTIKSQFFKSIKALNLFQKQEKDKEQDVKTDFEITTNSKYNNNNAANQQMITRSGQKDQNKFKIEQINKTKKTYANSLLKINKINIKKNKNVKAEPGKNNITALKIITTKNDDILIQQDFKAIIDEIFGKAELGRSNIPALKVIPPNNDDIISQK